MASLTLFQQGEEVVQFWEGEEVEGEAGASLLCAVIHCQPRESIKTQQDGAAEGCIIALVQ